MRHNIIFKFIAVFLCAASLLGAVGGAAGIFAMSELGLYSRSLEEIHADSTQNTVQALADELAIRYASRELGGANEYLLNQYYGTYWMQSAFDWDQVGYAIRDENGDVVEEREMDAQHQIYASYTLDTAGSRYLNILNTMTQDEYDAIHNPPTEPAYPTTEPYSELTVYNAVPVEGSKIALIHVSYADGSDSNYEAGDGYLGELTYYTSNQLIFNVQSDYADIARLFEDLGMSTPVAMSFMNTDGVIVLEISHPYSVLEEFSWNHDDSYFILQAMDNAVALPVGSVYDAIPPEGQAVSRCSVTYADGWSESVGGTPDIGYLGYDEDGFVVFTANSRGILEYRTEPVTYISFHDEDGNLVYEASDLGSVGTFSLEEDTMVFRSREATGTDSGLSAPEGNVYIYDDVPPQGYTVYKMDLWLKGSSTMLTIENGDNSLGTADHDDFGNVCFTAMDWRDFVFSKPAQVLYILMTGQEGRVLYEAYEADSRIGTGSPIGTFAYNADGDLVFSRSAAAAAASDEGMVATEASPTPQETIPEETIPQETVPENASLEVLTNIPVYAAPSENATVIDTLEAGSRVTMEETTTLLGTVWGKLTGSGWILVVPEELAAVQVLETADEAAEAGTEPTVADETVPATTEAEADTTNVTEPVVASESEMSTEPTYASDMADVTEPEVVPSMPPSADPYEIALAEDTLRVFGYYDHSVGENMLVEYTYETMPNYTVEVVLGPGGLNNQYEWVLLGELYLFREYLIPILIISIFLFAVTAVYLCCSAARRPGTTEVRANGLNCIPLDLYLAGAVGGVMLCALGFVEGGEYLMRQDLQIGLLFCTIMAFAACLLIVAFCFAFAAQVKTPGGYWWHNSICGRSLKVIAWLWNKFLKLCAWLWDKYDTKIEPMLVRLFKALWKLIRFFFLQLKRGVVWLVKLTLRSTEWLGQKLTRFVSMLPLTWQWLLTGFILVFLLYMMMRTYKVGYILLGFGVFFGVLLYAASSFGILLESAKRMRKGDLDSKVDDKLLIGSFRDFADELNGLADVAVVAAQKQLKSERMKTELITNVSHDIKTPLTSIINYVDLMEKPHSPEEQQAYLEVLSRQSQRLKKLIDDLMEMSKASTGNMAVDITKVNASEAVNQALGEFADKLDKAQLVPVFRQPDTDIYMMADGRLVWRVLSNLLSNAVKYALPGTRVYIDLMELEGRVVLSMKNISRDSLNIHADELLERFVRGDAARNTEGSGLGLNIAQSLMELQKGKLELLVDGDLFKVTLVFPGA